MEGRYHDDKLIYSQIESILLKYTNSVYLKVGLSVFYDGKNLLNYIERGYSLDVLYPDIKMNQIKELGSGSGCGILFFGAGVLWLLVEVEIRGDVL